MKDELNINYQFKKYLELVRLNKTNMSATQYTEMKRVFFGAFGQALIVLRDELDDNEDVAISELQNLLDQVGDFFLNESKQTN